jgi:site-specific DNA-cytosine methylase
LTKDKPAPAIRASKACPHYSENRTISIEEAKALTFDHDFILCGSDDDKLRQIGCAFPIEVATAIGRVVQSVLAYEYEGERFYVWLSRSTST